MLPTLGDVAQAVGASVLVFNCWQSWRNGQRAKKIVEEVKVIKEATNGLSAKLLTVTGEAKYAEGVKHGEKYAERNNL